MDKEQTNGQENGQTNRQNYNNFNLAMVEYIRLDKLFSSWSPETKMWTDGWTDKNGQTNKRNFNNFKRNLAMMVMYGPVKFEFDWTKCFRVRVQKRKCGRRDKWTNEQSYTNFERNLAMM